MYVLTNEEMREADGYTIGTLGVPSLVLMERAGKALAEEAQNLAKSGRIVCVCGGGNNGGDGFVCARILKEQGREVDAVFFAERISEECRVNLKKWQAVGGEILTAIPKDREYALIVDCLVGTGLRGALTGKNVETAKDICERKHLGAKVLSADIPSGVCGENGKAEGAAVQADVTLCIGEMKVGTALGDGLDYAGVRKRADIGIVLPHKDYATEADRALIKSILPVRKRNSHKGSYGKAAIVGGSIEYTGAAYLSAAACMRSGAGYTTLYVPKEILPYYVLKSPELLLKPSSKGYRYEFNEGKAAELLSYDSVAYGMGMGVSEAVAKGAAYLLRSYTGRLVLDADGLNSLAAYKKEEFLELFQNKKCDVVITPHIKEFSRLSGEEVSEIIAKGLYAATPFAKEYGVTVLLKSAASILTDGKRVVLNTSGTSGQAKGGSGDVLSGVIAGLCAMGTSAFDGACAAAYLVGKAAEIATAVKGEYSLTATDIIESLGSAFLFVTENADKGGGEE